MNTSKVERQVKALFKLDSEIASLEDQLNKMKSKRHLMATVDLPELMAEFGSSIWEDARYVCKVDYKIYGSIPADAEKHQEAIDYLFELGQEALISADLTASFARGDIRTAKKFGRILRSKMSDLGVNEPIKIQSKVNHMTLQKLGRDMIKANEPFKMEVLGLRGMTMATVKEKRGSNGGPAWGDDE
jgi:hypothetical protein